MLFLALFTLIGVGIFQSNGVYLLDRNGVDGSLLQPYGYGLVLAWLSWVFYIIAVPFAWIQTIPAPPVPPTPPVPPNPITIIEQLVRQILLYIEKYLHDTEISTNREIKLIREILKKIRDFSKDHHSTSSERMLLKEILRLIQNFVGSSDANEQDPQSTKNLVDQILPDIKAYLNNTKNPTRSEIKLMRKILEKIQSSPIALQNHPSTSSERSLLEDILRSILDDLQLRYKKSDSAPNPSPS